MVDVAPTTQAGITSRKLLLAEGVFHLIAERIISGELAPGDRIRDGDLAAELAVSRTPVREALQRLERIGMVTMYPSRYTEVTSIDESSLSVAREFAGLQAAIIVRLACPRLTDAELDAVTELIAHIVETAEDAAACSTARRSLIGYLAARTGNALQQALVDEASISLARTLKTYEIPIEDMPALRQACADLDAAMQARDKDAAERACRQLYSVS